MMQTKQIALLTTTIALLLATAEAAAEPLDVYGATDNPDPFIQVTVRGGAGSLFGPQFDAGQPMYAQSDGDSFENRAPYSYGAQLVSTYGGAATLEFPTGRWTFGASGLGGVHHANRSADDRDTALSNGETFRGLTLGGGVRATYGLGTWRLTLDGIVAHTRMNGELAWTVASDGGIGPSSGRATWQTSYLHGALLAGVELEVGPFFAFGNAGAQYLPEQNVPHKINGALPTAATQKGGELTLVDGTNTTKRVDGDIAIAATIGVGFRF